LAYGKLGHLGKSLENAASIGFFTIAAHFPLNVSNEAKARSHEFALQGDCA
jgi:hypothetical protein